MFLKHPDHTNFNSAQTQLCKEGAVSNRDGPEAPDLYAIELQNGFLL